MNMNIIVDVSGSMTENGKDSVVKYLLYAIDGFSRDNNLGEYKIFQWGKRLDEVVEPFKLSFDSGKVSDELLSFLNNHIDEKNIIISDGGFSREIKKGIKEIPDKKNIYYLGIGSDCDIAAIRAVAMPNRIFAAQEVISCMRVIINAG